jgi:hypothetical protein
MIVKAVGLVLTVLLAAVMIFLTVDAWQRLSGPPDANDEITSVLVEATLLGDGTVTQRITYTFFDPVGDFVVFVPEGVTAATVNGEPVDTFVAISAFVPGREVVMEWDVRGQTRRFADGALVPWSLTRSQISQVGLGDPIDVQGVLYLPEGPPARRATTSLADQDVVIDGRAVRLSGRMDPWDDTDAAVEVPAVLVPRVPEEAGSMAAVWAGEAGRLEAARPVDVLAGGQRTFQLVATILLTVVVVLGLGLYLFGLVRKLLQRAFHKAQALGERAEPPAGLRPSLVGLAVGGAGRGERSLVAASILDLAARGHFAVDGITSEQFILRFEGAPHDLQGSDRILSEGLRAEAGMPPPGTPLELHGPPLWQKETKPMVRRFRRALLAEARHQGLISFALGRAGFFVLTILVGTLAAMTSDATSAPTLAILLATFGPWVALVAAACNGVGLTKKGLRVRTEGEAYGRYLRSMTQLPETGVPGIVIWGETLAYAAALGAAPKAAEGLSPRTAAGRRPSTQPLGPVASP